MGSNHSWSLCQSCGRPILKEGDYGSNADGTVNEEYCSLCLGKGKFFHPELTREKMIEQVADQITKNTAMPRSRAEEIARNLIPSLKRWQKSS